jgi:hypothetical protein
MMVVAHGPAPEVGPYAPDYLVARSDDGREAVLTRDGESDVPPGRLPRRASLATPEPMRPGHWPIVFAAGDLGLGKEVPRVVWVLSTDEALKRRELAGLVLQGVAELRGKPELALASIRAAGALVAIDVDKRVGELLAAAAPGESLVEAYDRQRRKA